MYLVRRVCNAQINWGLYFELNDLFTMAKNTIKFVQTRSALYSIGNIRWRRRKSTKIGEISAWSQISSILWSKAHTLLLGNCSLVIDSWNTEISTGSYGSK